MLAIIEQDRRSWIASIDPDPDTLRYLTEGARIAADFAVGTGGRVAVLDGDSAHPQALAG